MSAKLRGIFTPTLVPLDAKDKINETELRRFISWLIDHGVHGLYPNGSTGEFTRFTAEERRRIVEIVCDENRGRVTILAGAAEANVKETINACAAYAAMGADAVAIVSPFYFKLSPESVYAYFAEIARNSPIDITLYNIPMFASPIDVPTIRRLALEFPRVVGIKDSSGDLAFMMRMIAAVRPQRPDFSFLTGWEAVLAPMLMIGCDGGTNASSNAVPEVTRRIFELCEERKFDEAMKWNYRILELFDAMLYPFEFPDGFRAAAALRGFNFGVGRQPQSPAQKSDAEALEKVLQCILSDFELVAPPAAGCAPRIRQPEQDKIKQVVWDVLFELEKRGVVWSQALAIVEVGGWSLAMAVLDSMEKAASVELLQTELNDAPGVCLKLEGSVGDVEIAVEAAQQMARVLETAVITGVIPRPVPGSEAAYRAQPDFNPLIEQPTVRNPEKNMSDQSHFAIGLIETQGFTAVVEAIDTALKTASVEVLAREKLGGGYITVVIKGDVAAVRAAIDAAKGKVEGLGKLIAAHVIPSPSQGVLSLLPK